MATYIQEFKNRKITSRGIAQQLISVVDRNFQRRANQQVRMDYYRDNQLVYLQRAINNQFAFPDRLRLQTEFVNVTRMIVDELGSLYTDAPIREIMDGTESDKELFELIADKASLNSVMDTNNKLVKLCKTTLVRPVWRDDKIEYVIYTPNMFDVLENPENPKQPLAIIYANNYDESQYVSYDGMSYNKVENQNQFKGTNIVYHVWTADRHFSFNVEILKSGEKQAIILENDENPENINPYGTLDIFVPFRDEFVYDGFFCSGGQDLINANELINIKKTELNYLTKMQSFGVPVRKGADANSSSFIADPSMTIDLPADSDMARGADFKFESPNPKIIELSDDIQSKLRTIAIKYKLNPEMFSVSGNRSSAESIQLQNFYLSKAIKRDKSRFASYEGQLYNATRIVNNLHSQKKLSDNSWLKVSFSDAETPQTLEQEDKHNLLLFTNGLISKAEWLLKVDPDLGTIEQAEEKLKKIEAERGGNSGEAQQQSNTLFGQ